ncbi:MAG: DoxX family protein [Cyanobacteria bacterium P01_A01_bin.84]
MNLQKYIPLAGRAFLSVIFLYAGVNHILGFQGTVEMMAKRSLPIPNLLLLGTIFCCLAGGASILLGFKVKWGAILLILFLIPATLVFHNPIADPSEVNAFLKNIGLIGAMLLIYYFGSGPVSLDTSSPVSTQRDYSSTTPK